MSSQPYSTHWHFALTAAMFRLEYLVWHFDFVMDVGEQGYVGVQPPDALSDIIAGFLGEGAYLYEGDKARLITMQTYIADQLAPAYHAGQSRAHDYWKQASPDERQQLLNATIADVRQIASEYVPPSASPTEWSWFMEGFCVQWWRIEYIHYLRAYNGSIEIDG